MPYKTIPDTDIHYALIAFNADGNERSDDPHGVAGSMSASILKDVEANVPTHVFFFSHGWKGDVPAAIDQYNRWIKAMTDLSADVAAMGPNFQPLWIGLHWPSLPWGDDELGSGSFEPSPVRSSELLERYVARFGGDADAVRKQLQIIFSENETNAGAMSLSAPVADAYRRLADEIGRKAGRPGGPPDAEEAAFDPAQAFEAGNEGGAAFGGGPDFGGLLGPLRQLSFWKMKNRARTVGEGGMHSFIASLQQALPTARFHLMGHSFGCIVVSSILGGPDGKTALPRAVDSLVLVQGALSLWAYAEQIPDSATNGYFNAMIQRGAVRGPIVTTRSEHDTAVGTFYPLAARLSGKVDFAPLPEYGAIGAFGIQGRAAVSGVLLPQTGNYSFKPGTIHNLESSNFISKMDGASGAHSDIDGPQVAHALWQTARV
jgi:general stress protein YciG